MISILICLLQEMSNFYQNLAYDLLEMQLNGDGINSQILKSMFKNRQGELESMDFGDGITLENLDKHLYGSGPMTDVIEIRAAKKHELYNCVPCSKTFKRIDNFRRHLRSTLHGRRKAQFDAAKAQKSAKLEDETKEESSSEHEITTKAVDQDGSRSDGDVRTDV